jgi:hypothetical protein
LNFDIAEKLEKEKLAEIAVVYMQKIGFAEQPFLVYQHKDAGHPHIHIISTNIQKNGKRISMHNIGRNQSTQARKEIEIIYQLVKAEKQNVPQENKPLNVQRVVYGKSETKRGITNVLNEIVNKYKYTSLAELNAILKLYNVAVLGKFLCGRSEVVTDIYQTFPTLSDIFSIYLLDKNIFCCSLLAAFFEQLVIDHLLLYQTGFRLMSCRKRKEETFVKVLRVQVRSLHCISVQSLKIFHTVVFA